MAIGLSQKLGTFFTNCSCKRDFQAPVRTASNKGKLPVTSKTLQMFFFEFARRKTLHPVKSLAASFSPASALGQTGTVEISQPESGHCDKSSHGCCVCFLKKITYYFS